jgi:hypothetical protein
MIAKNQTCVNESRSLHAPPFGLLPFKRKPTNHWKAASKKPEGAKGEHALGELWMENRQKLFQKSLGGRTAAESCPLAAPNALSQKRNTFCCTELILSN